MSRLPVSNVSETAKTLIGVTSSSGQYVKKFETINCLSHPLTRLPVIFHQGRVSSVKLIDTGNVIVVVNESVHLMEFLLHDSADHSRSEFYSQADQKTRYSALSCLTATHLITSGVGSADFFFLHTVTANPANL